MGANVAAPPSLRVSRTWQLAPKNKTRPPNNKTLTSLAYYILGPGGGGGSGEGWGGEGLLPKKRCWLSLREESRWKAFIGLWASVTHQAGAGALLRNQELYQAG